MNNPSKIFDGLLVLQYRSGNIKALNLLVKKYHKKLCKQSNWYVNDIDIAQDIVQDSWKVVIKKLHNLKDVNAFEYWVMRIVTRKSLDYLKKEKGKTDKLKVYMLTHDEEDTNEVASDRIRKLNIVIKELSKNQQTVLRLFYTQDYSLNEISIILGVSVGTVKSRLFHAREKLKEKLE